MKSLKLLSLLLALLCLSGCCNPSASGNSLTYSTDLDSWKPFTATTNLLPEDCLWEPGQTAIIYIRNTDASDRTVTLSFVDTLVTENVNGDDIRLTKLLYVGILDNVTEPLDRITAQELTETTACPISALGTQTLHSGVTAIVIYMPETVGNEANWVSTPPQIALHIS